MPIEDTKQGKVAQYLQVGCLSKKEGVFKWGDGEGELIKSLFRPHRPRAHLFTTFKHYIFLECMQWRVVKYTKTDKEN